MDGASDPQPESSEPCYIDYNLFLSPTFSAPSYANNLVLSTNNSSDTPLDLSTPLSKVLFDIQEVDSHIHTLTSSSALPLLSHTQERTAASQHIVDDLGANLRTLTSSYERLEEEVTQKQSTAAEIHTVSERLWHTLRLGRSVSRALQLGRALEVQMGEASGRAPMTSGAQENGREGHRASVRAATTIFTLRSLLADSAPGGEGEDLHKVNAITSLQREILNPAERLLNSKATQIVKDFALSTLAGGGAGTYAQASDVRARTISALCTLYLLSPNHPQGKKVAWEPENLVTAVTEYLRNALSSSATAIGRAINNLAGLERVMVDVSARCQNIVALEQILAKTPVPELPSASTDEYILTPGEVPTGPAPKQQTLLPPILASLETSNLASFFWRTLAGALAPRVQELVNKGGPSARALKQHRVEVREMVKKSVEVGCQGVEQQGRKGDWGREVAVMVGAVVGGLGR